MRKNVGYFEGTDPLLLTRLVVNGVDTYPLSNGLDHHGKQVSYLTPNDGIELVIGYLHKVMPLDEMRTTVQEMLFSCTSYGIPVFLIVPEDLIEEARESIDEIPEGVSLVTPEESFERVMAHVG